MDDDAPGIPVGDRVNGGLDGPEIAAAVGDASGFVAAFSEQAVACLSSGDSFCLAPVRMALSTARFRTRVRFFVATTSKIEAYRNTNRGT